MTSTALDFFLKFDGIIRNEISNNNDLLLSASGRESLKSLLNDINDCLSRSDGDDVEFSKMVINMDIHLPLEALWYLQDIEFIYLNNYVYFHPAEVTKIPELLIKLLTMCNQPKINNEEECIIMEKMCTDFLIELIFACEGPQIGNGIFDSETEWVQSSGIIWQSVKRQFLQKLLSSPHEIHFNYLKNIREKRKLTENVRSKIYHDHLQLIAKHKPYTTAHTAIFQQSSWTKNNTNSSIVNVITEILQHITNPLNELFNIMQQEEISWKWSLTAVSVCINVLPETVPLLRQTIDDLLNKAFTQFDVDTLLMAFLLVRQVSYENLHSFDTYPTWYSKKFGIDAVGPTTKSKAAFEFLIKFLTSIIPSETPEILQIHLEKSLSIPPQCLSVMQEFKSILRTRVSDLRAINEI